MGQNRESRNPHIYGQLIYSKDVNKLQLREHSLFNTDAEQLDIYTCKTKQNNSHLTPYTKIDSKHIIDLNKTWNYETSRKKTDGKSLGY